MAGSLTTHVLDIAHGVPAAGITIELWRIDDQGRHHLLTTAITNRDGRTNAPLLEQESFTPGIYELIFAVGAYFHAGRTATAVRPFLDRVPVRFGIDDASVHYHVPLLVSQWSYSTYRGS